MHRWMMAFGALAFAASPASASVYVYATINKDVTHTITENIEIVKNIDITAVVTSVPTSAAEADALINQTNTYNQACENCAEKTDTIGGPDEADGSVNNNSGIAVVNQAAGNNNNQGSSIAMSIDFRGSGPPADQPPEGDQSLAHAQAHGEQVNGSYYYVPPPDGQTEPLLVEIDGGAGNEIAATNLLYRDALIQNSINNNSGVVHVNQASGNNNNQANGLALALGLRPGGGVALAEADLGQFNTNNTVYESGDGTDPSVGINKSATIDTSVTNNTGIVGVNQTAGNMANQANIVAIAAAVVSN